MTATRILETPRLVLRQLAPADAAFILELVNEPSWLRFIGDKNVRNLDDARVYIENGPMKMYAERGFGLWLVERKEDGAALGICGLIKRDTLPDVDLGYAFLPRYWSQGYAQEAARGTLEHGRRNLGMGRIVAITAPGNEPSAKLLRKLGFVREATLDMAPKDPVDLYASA